MQLAKYSFGTGDRFGMQGLAQLDAIREAKALGCELAIVWNKSQREHSIVGSQPADVRLEADRAVQMRGWTGPYHVDADHIHLGNVDSFLAASDFFTIDVAEAIGKKAEDSAIAGVLSFFSRYEGQLKIEGIDKPLALTRTRFTALAEKYLFAAQQAGIIYRHIAEAKGRGNFITEVSMDETDEPQGPEELFFILAALAYHEVPVQTIAPKFTGRFNKGVDYQGDIKQFTQEFSDDICVIKKAIKDFGLPPGLKLSVHSGSDKFSLYPIIRESIRRHAVGVHIKTAGTTWLEELIGLAETGGEATAMVKEIYRSAYHRFDALCQPYISVIAIDREALPKPEQVDKWGSAFLANVIRHDQTCPEYDANVRQLLHVGYKIAAELGESYLTMVEKHAETIARNVTYNLLERHVRPLFL